jgi:hypothetical protein
LSFSKELLDLPLYPLKTEYYLLLLRFSLAIIMELRSLSKQLSAD